MPYNLAKILAAKSSPNTPYTTTYNWAIVSLSLFFFGGKLYRTGIWYDEPESVLPIALKISSPILGGFQLGIAHKEDPVYL